MAFTQCVLSAGSLVLCLSVNHSSGVLARWNNSYPLCGARGNPVMVGQTSVPSHRICTARIWTQIPGFKSLGY